MRRVLLALATVLVPGPALADLACTTTNGRMICDYSAALIDAASAPQIADAQALVIVASAEDGSFADHSEGGTIGSMCLSVAPGEAAGC